MTSQGTMIVWFHLRAAELADEFERFMVDDRDVVRSALDTVVDWRLTRPMDVPGQASDPADYVLIAEIVEVERWADQETAQLQRLADGLEHLVSSRSMLVLEAVL